MSWLETTLAMVAMGFSLSLWALASNFRHRVAITRAKFQLYEARDRLYLAAARGLLDVNSELFRTLRDGTISAARCADQLGAKEYLWLRNGGAHAESGDTHRLRAHLRSLPAVARHEVVQIALSTSTAMLALMRQNSRAVRFFVATDDFASERRRASLASRIEQAQVTGAKVRRAKIVRNEVLELKQLQSEQQAFCG